MARCAPTGQRGTRHIQIRYKPMPIRHRFDNRMTRRSVLTVASGAFVLPLLARRALAQARRGGTLTIASQGEPRTLVPLLDTNTNTRNISTKIVEGLLTYDAQFTPKPLLAT